jgi:hypothetical protein
LLVGLTEIQIISLALKDAESVNVAIATVLAVDKFTV